MGLNIWLIMCSVIGVILGKPLPLSAPLENTIVSPSEDDLLDLSNSGYSVSSWSPLFLALSFVGMITCLVFLAATCTDCLKTQDDQLKAERGQLTAQVDQLKAENEQLKEQIEQLRAERDQLKAENEQLKEQIEFLDAHFYRADVLLDPSTAHPRLEVSEDEKSVKDSGKISVVSNNNERFDSHIFILAKEGFSHGKHYWEVEVGQKKNWDLGVASESALRKGTIKLSPDNRYFVVGRDGESDYWARTDPWTHLKIHGKPTKIGIFLNMADRSLTFYDVQSKSELHTFTITDSGKLYPFFSTGSLTTESDNQPLKIIEEHKEE